MNNLEFIINEEHKGSLLNYINTTQFSNLFGDIKYFIDYLSQQNSNILNETYFQMVLKKSTLNPELPITMEDLNLYYRYTVIMPVFEKIMAYQSLQSSLEHIPINKQNKISNKI